MSSGLRGVAFANPASPESKTVAKTAEKNRRRELEEGFNNFADQRQERIRSFAEMADEYFDAYKLRLPDSARFAEYAIDISSDILAARMLVDFNEAAVIQYQNARLGEGAAPKSINEEMGFLLRILGDHGTLSAFGFVKRRCSSSRFARQSEGLIRRRKRTRMLLEPGKLDLRTSILL